MNQNQDDDEITVVYVDQTSTVEEKRNGTELHRVEPAKIQSEDDNFLGIVSPQTGEETPI